MNQTLTLQLINRSSSMQNLVMVTSDCDQMTSTVLVSFHRAVIARPASPACLPSFFEEFKGKQIIRVRPLLAWILAANAPTQSSGAPVTVTGASSKNYILYLAFSIRNSRTAKCIKMIQNVGSCGVHRD